MEHCNVDNDQVTLGALFRYC